MYYGLRAEVSFEVQWSMFRSATKCILRRTGIALHFGMGCYWIFKRYPDTVVTNNGEVGLLNLISHHFSCDSNILSNDILLWLYPKWVL